MSTVTLMLPNQTRVESLPQIPAPPENRRRSAPWHLISFDNTLPYEAITQQYYPLGITVQGGIAVRPSNPQFIPGQRQPVLMPTRGNRGLNLQITQPLVQMEIQLLGSQPVTLVALNGEGHCLALAQTQEQPPREGDAPLVEQGILLQTRGISRIYLESRAPFVVTQIRVQRSQQPVTKGKVIPLPSRQPCGPVPH
ncbi:hypothetical protein [Leptolyngbya sp. PCC 6406]|uniref:hypothetical protein n=1 Tax=Leptolyngbya sp. PCC 6406 TaxID=1173264 RepID=UPI0002AC4154|nr:hypothetical protein [Leptolyngbya sp. PCC 6406]